MTGSETRDGGIAVVVLTYNRPHLLQQCVDNVLGRVSEKTTEIKAATLPAECRAEGAVLRVPVLAGNQPEWTSARRDKVEEKRRLDEGAARLDRLRKRDPGGDISL